MILNKEIIFYTVVWTGAVLSSIYAFAAESRYLFTYLDDVYGDLKPGWSFLKRRKDVADFEWESFLYISMGIAPWIILQLILIEACSFFKTDQICRYIRITLAILFISNEFGSIVLGIILLQPCLFIAVGFLKSQVLLWLTNGICLFLFSLYKEISKDEDFLTRLNITEKQADFIITAIYWTNLRAISYCLDDATKKSKNLLEIGKFLDFLEYCIYLPTLMFGPYISYEDFRTNYENRGSTNRNKRYRWFIQDVCRCLFWLIFMEFVLHFIYVNATSFQPQIVMSLGAWAFYGYGYTMGQAFHMKYVVMYGFSTKVAKFEGVTVPALPKCIGRIHLYSDMWKYFDPGLHKFLVRYIYVPTMQSKEISNKIFSSLLCFAFVYVWHGLEAYVFIWACLNFLGVSLEIFSGTFFDKYVKNSPAICNISCTWLRRLKCLVASPLLMMSAVSNFYFFAGKNIGDIFVLRILNGECYVNITLLLALYCCCQVSTELRMTEKDKKKDKNK